MTVVMGITKLTELTKINGIKINSVINGVIGSEVEVQTLR